MDRIIDKAAWPRREIFDFFSGISNPFYAVTFRQDVTELRNYCKVRKISFYYGLIYLCCKALQDVPAFACRIRGENVVELGEQKPSFTDLKKGSELFHIVTMPCEGSIVEFCGKAREVSGKQDCFIDMAGQADDLIYFSCLPWMDGCHRRDQRAGFAGTKRQRRFHPQNLLGEVYFGKRPGVSGNFRGGQPPAD